MKILFIISSLTSGGAQRVLTTLSNYWVKQGREVTILSILSEDKNFYILDDKVEIVSLNRRYNNTLLNSLWYLFGIRKVIKSENPTIVISFISSINIFTLISSIGLSTPILISERNTFDSLHSKFWRGLRRIVYPWSKGLVVLSQYDYKKFTYVKSKKIIFNPLNSNNLLEVQFKDKENLLIAVGSLTEQKGFDRLLLALSMIELTNWKVMIIGEGSKREELTRLIKTLKLSDKVSLVGRKSNVYNYYKRASIFVLSSHWEGFPNVLAEAMAHGCSAIAFDCKTGPSEMIKDGVNGYLVEENNIEQLSKKILETINNKQLRETFFYNSLKIKDHLDIKKITIEWEEYIEQIRMGKEEK